MLFYKFYGSSHSPQSSRKNSTSPELVYPLNEYYFYHICDNIYVSHLNTICRAGFYTDCIKFRYNFDKMTQQIDIYNITRIFLIFQRGLIKLK